MKDHEAWRLREARSGSRPPLPPFDERAEIMRWLAEGERLSESYGVRMAAAVAAAKRAFLPQADPVSRFLAEACGKLAMLPPPRPQIAASMSFPQSCSPATWNGAARRAAPP